MFKKYSVVREVEQKSIGNRVWYMYSQENNEIGWVHVGFAWNPSYLGDWNQDEPVSTSAQAKKFVRPYFNGK
jgi:hypothetical protein